MLIDDNKIRIIKSMYQKGMRVKLRKMEDPYTDLKEGDEGTIEFVDDIGTKCNQYYSGYPAISRRDNKTEICSSCGTKEAMENFQNYYKKKGCD